MESVLPCVSGASDHGIFLSSNRCVLFQSLPQGNEQQPRWYFFSVAVRTQKSLLFDGQVVRHKVNQLSHRSILGCLNHTLLGRKFLIATTGMVSGSSIIESIAGVGRATARSKEANL
jgi:hypothetical protein